MLTSNQKVEIMQEIARLLDGWPENVVTESKNDFSPVTQFDLSISKYLESYFSKLFPVHSIISEENAQRILGDKIVVIDPIDGTGGFSKGSFEWVVSLAIVSGDKSWGWMFNPITGFSVASDDVVKEKKKKSDTIKVLVSKSEWKKFLSDASFSKEIEFFPTGSAAYKLGLLASEDYDVSITFRDKSLWDIWGGVQILKQNGISSYENGEEIVEASKIKFGPLIYWCRPELKELVESKIIKVVKDGNYGI